MWLLDRPIAHRGLHDADCPENSIAAFKNAMLHSYPVELDVRLTKDNAVVVFHDEALFRMTGARGKVQDHTWRELSGYRLLGTAERIPLFDQVLSEVGGRIPLLIEIKNNGRSGPLEEVLAGKLASYAGDYAVQSFNPLALKWFKDHRRDIQRGQLSGFYEDEKINPVKKLVLRMMFLNRLSSPDFIGYDVNHLPYWPVTIVKKSGKPVLGWTVESEAVQDRISGYVDNIIFQGFLP